LLSRSVGAADETVLASLGKPDKHLVTLTAELFTGQTWWPMEQMKAGFNRIRHYSAVPTEQRAAPLSGGLRKRATPNRTTITPFPFGGYLTRHGQRAA
jgi:hypothetical protein